MALQGFDDEQVKEAGWVVQSVAGASAYIYGTDYDMGKFKEELDLMVEYIKKKQA